jgi:hypothetical protein
MINFKLGYYKVGDKIFADKLEAVLFASQERNNIEWHFNDEIYNNINWTEEPETSLDEFYKIRAQQIRDEYDYVVILCSGGGDSTNVVWSFLRNNIHVDEIVASAPIEGIKNYNVNNLDNSAENTISETLLVQLPLMEQIHREYPKIKITINDYFRTLIDYKTDNWLFRCGEWIHPSGASRYDLSKLTHLRKLAESGKKIAIVYGIDKPVLFQDEDDSIKISIIDLTVNVQRPAFAENYENVNNVLFYFAPELPQMQIKQAHSVAKWIHLPENSFAHSKMFNVKSPLSTFESNRIRHSFYERAILPCIYPSTHKKVFQGHKPTRIFLGEHDEWFYKQHSNTKTYEMIRSDFRNFYKEIDPHYLNISKSGFKVYAKIYKLGHVNNFTNIK